MIDTQTHRDGTLVYTPGSDLDLLAAANLRDALHTLMQPDMQVTIDLSRVEYIDAAGLSVLLGLARRARSMGATLRLSNPQRGVRWRLELVSIAELGGASSRLYRHDAA